MKERLALVGWWVLVVLVVASGGLLAPLLLVGLAWKKSERMARPNWLDWIW